MRIEPRFDLQDLSDVYGAAYGKTALLSLMEGRKRAVSQILLILCRRQSKGKGGSLDEH